MDIAVMNDRRRPSLCRWIALSTTTQRMSVNTD